MACSRTNFTLFTLYCLTFQATDIRVIGGGGNNVYSGAERLGALSLARVNLPARDWKSMECGPQRHAESQVSLAKWDPLIPNPFNPLRNTWMASDLQQTPT